MNDNPNQPAATLRVVNAREARKLVERSSFWRPDTEPTTLRIHDMEILKSGANKWGRPQIFATATLNDGRIVTLAMSRSCAAHLFAVIDEAGIDDQDVPHFLLTVKKTGRGLETSYVWTIGLDLRETKENEIKEKLGLNPVPGSPVAAARPA